MTALSGAYLAFLWLPVSPEKIVTFVISIALLRWLFPKDEKTLAVLKELYGKAKQAIQKKKPIHRSAKKKKTLSMQKQILQKKMACVLANLKLNLPNLVAGKQNLRQNHFCKASELVKNNITL